MTPIETTLRDLYMPVALSSGAPVTEVEMVFDSAVKSALAALADFSAYDERAAAYFLKRQMEANLRPLWEGHITRREVI